ncbi:MAG: type I restriction enzyme M protein [Desulfobacteraceae bacterium Eth-SRB1]|nr:MAG: type I restriction enzyme M protein [Desulfobacteraceae bacterium Eth-SRB1]
MARSTVHYADSDTNNTLKKLHNKLRPAGTPVQRVEYIIELLLLRIFEVKLKQDQEFRRLRDLFKEPNDDLLFSCLYTVANKQLLPTINEKFFPFYAGILSHARKVYKKTNLSQKVLDQLVLIEEVFKNSNFTNNVKSGNLQEIISLVSNINEERLLKTDLLGDAIESALSETGGTKDLGLHRTPDHVRQFMVGVAAPSFSDSIYDPACGTAGFLFDSWGYVTEAIRRDGTWPGPKAHPEISAYFEKYFSAKDAPMPSAEQAISFYRSGISGTEYLGVIRKMAAINLYIRKLNPSAIVQGDSLALFNPAEHGNSKTIILANPPFGAERDQEAYSNIWEEYPREAETTLLFVKLMLDSLASGGVCAVVVSEGFLTWDQTSARALRKMLLDDACLKAVISLPQGVFVSKSGVGPKTSILVFEKGGRTDNVWFYKVTNDGYTMGTNRQPQKGCQLVDALKLYDSYIRKGEMPRETKHSFSISAEWIRVLDPRIKKRIEQDTHKEFSAKTAREKRKLEKKIKKQLKDGKIDQLEFDSKLAQHEEIWRSKTLNEIAKRIEKAHLYSFNLGNYRSNLSKQQIDEWNSFFTGDKNHSDLLSLDEKFERLHSCFPDNAHDTLAYFDIQNGLEFDIVRQYLGRFSEEELKQNNHLAELQKIIESGAKYPLTALYEIVVPKNIKIKKNEYDNKTDIVEKISFADGAIHYRVERKTGMDLYSASPDDIVTSKINFHQGALALADRHLVCSTHYQIYEIDQSEVLPEYLVYILRSKEFLNKIIKQKNNGIKTEQGAGFVLQLEIPLPELGKQREIVTQLTSLKNVFKACETISTNFNLHVPELFNADTAPLGEAVLFTKNGWSPRCNGGPTPVLSLACLQNGTIDLKARKWTDLSRDDIDRFFVKEGDFFYSRGNTPELVALAGIASKVNENIVFPDLLTSVEFDKELILSQYAVVLFNSTFGRQYFGNVPLGASPSMVKVSQKYMKNFQVPFLGNIKMQQKIIEKSQRLLSACESISLLEANAKETLGIISSEIWE